MDLYDPTGMWFGSKLVSLVAKVGAVLPYSIYFGAYYVAKSVNAVGCSSWFGVAQPVTCALSHGAVAASPLPALEAIGLAGDAFYDRFIKHESVCDEGNCTRPGERLSYDEEAGEQFHERFDRNSDSKTGAPCDLSNSCVDLFGYGIRVSGFDAVR